MSSSRPPDEKKSALANDHSPWTSAPVLLHHVVVNAAPPVGAGPKVPDDRGASRVPKLFVRSRALECSIPNVNVVPSPAAAAPNRAVVLARNVPRIALPRAARRAESLCEGTGVQSEATPE